MKALTLRAIGGLEHLAVLDLPAPAAPARGQVLVRMMAAALNRLDLLMTEGLPGVNLTFPHIVATDGAGVVDRVGEGVWQVAPGDRVMINAGLSCGCCTACLEGEESHCANFRVMGEHVPGLAAEYVVVPAENLAQAPEWMSWPEAAGFSLATLTAWRMLTTRARVRAGESVLIWGIGGGVALAALQIAVLLGARAIVTSGSDAKLETARRLGASETINHSRADVVAEVRRLTPSGGADVVLDSVGSETWQSSLRALRKGGRLVICGATSGPGVSLDLRRLFWYQWSVLGSTMGSRREYAEIVRLAHQGRLRPVIDRVVPLAEGASVYQRMQQGEQTGKLVIEVSP
jgi:NADPH:quinone reductase-like Zn-dependent oxidoreductase